MVRPNQLKRPHLTVIPLAEALPPRPGTVSATMLPKQWDALIAEVYEQGGTLIEVNHRERPVRAYRRLAVAKSATTATHSTTATVK